jgi:hypothetical protein
MNKATAISSAIVSRVRFEEDWPFGFFEGSGCLMEAVWAEGAGFLVPDCPGFLLAATIGLWRGELFPGLDCESSVALAIA